MGLVVREISARDGEPSGEWAAEIRIVTPTGDDSATVRCVLTVAEVRVLAEYLADGLARYGEEPF